MISRNAIVIRCKHAGITWPFERHGNLSARAGHGHPRRSSSGDPAASAGGPHSRSERRLAAAKQCIVHACNARCGAPYWYPVRRNTARLGLRPPYRRIRRANMTPRAICQRYLVQLVAGTDPVGGNMYRRKVARKAHCQPSSHFPVFALMSI